MCFFMEGSAQYLLRCTYGEYWATNRCEYCSPGKFQGSASHLITSCEDCVDGTYSSLGAQRCSVHTICREGTYVYEQPSLEKNRICAECAQGKYSDSVDVTDCSTCVDGKFQSSIGKSSCSGFNYCQPGQKIKVYGSKTQDYVCEACTSPWTTISVGETTCSYCVAGQYKTRPGSVDICTVCECPDTKLERYIFCPVGSVGATCKSCTGTEVGKYCEKGKQPNRVCNGLGDQDTTCVACGPGFHKPATLNQRNCEACGTGFYKLPPASTDDCVTCSNKPPWSVYDVWPTGTPASSNSCPWYSSCFCIVACVYADTTMMWLAGRVWLGITGVVQLVRHALTLKGSGRLLD